MIGYCDDYLEFGRQGLYDVSPFDSLPVSAILSFLEGCQTYSRYQAILPDHTHGYSKITDPKQDKFRGQKTAKAGRTIWRRTEIESINTYVIKRYNPSAV
jgi:hypothetical protein